MNDRRFHIYSNPFGIIYNPISVNRNLYSIIHKKIITKSDLVQNKELYSHWDCHRSLATIEADTYVNQYNSLITESHSRLRDCEVLFLTLGSAYVYYTQDTQRPVANCQKYPASHFDKRLLSPASILEDMDTMIAYLREINPDLQVVYTISPVRHIKDGMIENNRSKANLITAVHETVDQYDYVHYFPSYELMMDDLRDYRFYNEDRVHPTSEAIDYIWSYFKEAYFDMATQDMIKQIEKLNRSQAHRPLFPDTQANLDFQRQTEVLRVQLEGEYPELNWVGKSRQ